MSHVLAGGLHFFDIGLLAGRETETANARVPVEFCQDQLPGLARR
jgi:hypothetical protein